MNTVKKLIVLMGLLSVLCAIPAMAQITNSVAFVALSAFYAGYAKVHVAEPTLFGWPNR
jgi:hypothetical protein